MGLEEERCRIEELSLRLAILPKGVLIEGPTLPSINDPRRKDEERSVAGQGAQDRAQHRIGAARN